jgi:hypothetical protein
MYAALFFKKVLLTYQVVNANFIALEFREEWNALWM